MAESTFSSEQEQQILDSITPEEDLSKHFEAKYSKQVGIPGTAGVFFEAAGEMAEGMVTDPSERDFRNYIGLKRSVLQEFAGDFDSDEPRVAKRARDEIALIDAALVRRNTGGLKQLAELYQKDSFLKREAARANGDVDTMQRYNNLVSYFYKVKGPQFEPEVVTSSKPPNGTIIEGSLATNPINSDAVPSESTEAILDSSESQLLRKISEDAKNPTRLLVNDSSEADIALIQDLLHENIQIIEAVVQGGELTRQLNLGDSLSNVSTVVRTYLQDRLIDKNADIARSEDDPRTVIHETILPGVRLRRTMVAETPQIKSHYILTLQRGEAEPLDTPQTGQQA